MANRGCLPTMIREEEEAADMVEDGMEEVQEAMAAAARQGFGIGGMIPISGAGDQAGGVIPAELLHRMEVVVKEDLGAVRGAIFQISIEASVVRSSSQPGRSRISAVAP